jgi:hypothetical protein
MGQEAKSTGYWRVVKENLGGKQQGKKEIRGRVQRSMYRRRVYKR